MRFDVVTKASPELVRRAFTDFTDRRPQIWNRTLDPKKYELREQGDTWADARESSPASPFWVVARYDWSEPAVIRWTVLESSFGGSGEGFVRIASGGNGGSRLHAEWASTRARIAKANAVPAASWPYGSAALADVASALDRYAQDDLS
jgi:hypothetical protein